MDYDSLVEARTLFDLSLGSGQNAQTAIDLFYGALELIEKRVKPVVNMDGFAKVCQSTKAIDDDIKYLAIQFCEKNGMEPKFRLALSLTKVGYMVYQFNAEKDRLAKEGNLRNPNSNIS